MPSFQHFPSPLHRSFLEPALSYLPLSTLSTSTVMLSNTIVMLSNTIVILSEAKDLARWAEMIRCSQHDTGEH